MFWNINMILSYQDVWSTTMSEIFLTNFKQKINTQKQLTIHLEWEKNSWWLTVVKENFILSS